ncbi:ABC transporter substrate-binding protein [Paraburkholderia sp.]|uniref:ABC transporter substrate-binding protein n=1 Tax=Paraburkholderia sp. TaxID=1926495 RepID=UPI003D6E0036
MVMSGKSFRAGRRRALAGLGAVVLASSTVGGAASAAVQIAPTAPTVLPRDARIVVLDWGLIEVVLSLGVVPVGVSRPVWYTRLDGDPPLPSTVVDTGLLFQPNFEVLAALKPDLIVVTPWHAPLRAMLERVAPTFTVAMFGPGLDIYPAVRAATHQLGAKLGRDREADALLQRADQQIAAAAQMVAGTGAAQRPLVVLRALDNRHVSVAGPHSLFDGVLRQLGLVNAWQGATDPQGMAEADLAALAQHSDAQAVLFGTPPAIAAGLSRSPLWHALPFVAQRGVAQIGPIPPTGGVVAATRFATSLVQALQGVPR